MYQKVFLKNIDRERFLHAILKATSKHSIPAALVLNSDQTPSSYVSVGKSTMAVKGSTTVPIEGLTDKWNITLNFVISLSGKFLPIQIIYSGKTTACQHCGVTFPRGFSVTQNPKHWSNEQETLKLIDEIIKPYIVKKGEELKLQETQPALLIWDVFKGQMTSTIKEKLKSLHIELVY